MVQRQQLWPLSARRFGQLRQLGSRPFGGRLGPEILCSVSTVTVLRTPPSPERVVCALRSCFDGFRIRYGLIERPDVFFDQLALRKKV